jgi:DNA-binding response OmpR family regulator
VKTKARRPRAEAASERKGIALVVDDDRETRLLHERILSADGWNVHTTGDGLSAIQILEAIQCDAAVVDEHIPGGPAGALLLEHVRRLYPQARLVLCSGWPTANARARVEAMGGVVIVKPFPGAELLEALEHAAA